jgi:hypothetical protein
LKINSVRDTVKQFLREALEANEDCDEVKIIGIDNDDSGWIVDAEVTAKDPTLPGHRVLKKSYYTVKLAGDLEVSSYKQVDKPEDG